MDVKEEITEMKEMVRSIHECILGTFDKQGLVGRVTDLEKKVNNWKAIAIFCIVSVVGIIADKISSFI